MEPRKTVATLSNAMDVGNPSNFVRIMELFHQEFDDLSCMLSGDTVTDAETLNTISEVEEKYGYTLDPHGAVAYRALEDYLAGHPGKKGFILETAHPVKFPEAVEKATGKIISIPGSLANLMEKEKKTVEINPNFEALKDFLLKTI